MRLSLTQAGTNIAATEGRSTVDLVLPARLEPPKFYSECEIRPLLRVLLRARIDQAGSGSSANGVTRPERFEKPMIAKGPFVSACNSTCIPGAMMLVSNTSRGDCSQ